MSYNYKQIIIARKDLNMSPGKLAAQVAHGAIGWMRQELINHSKVIPDVMVDRNTGEPIGIETTSILFEDAFDYCVPTAFYKWLTGDQTKIVCGARNKNHLLKAKKIAEKLELKEHEDFFLIYELCRTELKEEEEDGSTLTVIGFRPLPEYIANEISRHYQLY